MLSNLINRAKEFSHASKRSSDINTAGFPLDVTEEEAYILKSVKNFTMTSIERQVSLCRILDYILQNGINGDFVECGVWKGGSSMIAANKILKYNSDKKIWLYDTFQGMPAPDDRVDISHFKYLASEILENDIKTKAKSLVWAIGGEEEVKLNSLSTGFAKDNLRLIKGKVEDTIPSQGLPSSISVLRLDTDWYSSTIHELHHLYPRVEPGGFVIIDDYGHWQGARKATDEYFALQTGAPFLHRVDYTCRIIQKP